MGLFSKDIKSLEDLFVQTVEAAEPGVDQPVRRRRPS